MVSRMGDFLVKFTCKGFMYPRVQVPHSWKFLRDNIFDH